MYFSPQYVLIDLIRLSIAYAMYYYITRLERIKCLNKPTWKSTYIKFYAVVMIILIVLSMLSPMPTTMNTQAVIVSITLPLSVVLVYAIYTHVRELELEFKNCPASNDIMRVHEFLKLYSLIVVLGLIFIILLVISSILTFIKIPKYMAMQQGMNNDLRTSHEMLYNNSKKGKKGKKLSSAIKRVKPKTKK